MTQQELEILEINDRVKWKHKGNEYYGVVVAIEPHKFEKVCVRRDGDKIVTNRNHRRLTKVDKLASD